MARFMDSSDFPVPPLYEWIVINIFGFPFVVCLFVGLLAFFGGISNRNRT